MSFLQFGLTGHRHPFGTTNLSTPKNESMFNSSYPFSPRNTMPIFFPYSHELTSITSSEYDTQHRNPQPHQNAKTKRPSHRPLKSTSTNLRNGILLPPKRDTLRNILPMAFLAHHPPPHFPQLPHHLLDRHTLAIHNPHSPPILDNIFLRRTTLHVQ